MSKKNKVKLGVNIDHIATLRAVRNRSTKYPDIVLAAKEVMAAGADQITIHLREDRRHIHDDDLIRLSKYKKTIPINFEMAATKEMESIAIKYKPKWCCIVPEKRRELTTEGGLDVVKYKSKIKKLTKKLQENGINVSLFVAPNLKQIQASSDIGADAVEIHTGHWCDFKGDKKKKELKAIKDSAKLSHKLGLKTHAGHGLDLQSTKQICKIKEFEELNIGHSLVCHSVFVGLKQSVKDFLKQMK